MSELDAKEAADRQELSDWRRGHIVKWAVNLVGECLLVLLLCSVVAGGFAVSVEDPAALYLGLLVGWAYVGFRLWMAKPHR